MLPLECPYLSRNAMQSIAGQQPLPVKHFALKRKPKSAALRADLLQKCKKIVIRYLSVLMAIFPGEPVLAGFVGAKNNGFGGDNWSYKACKAPVKLSPSAN